MDQDPALELGPPRKHLIYAVAASAAWIPVWALGAFHHPALERAAPIFGSAFVFGLPLFGIAISWWSTVWVFRRRMYDLYETAVVLTIANTLGTPLAFLVRSLFMLFDGWSGPG